MPSPANYFYLIRALLETKDVISAIEALQEFEAAFPDIQDSKSTQAHLVSVRYHLSSSIETIQAADNLYYALLEQVQSHNARVPRVVLDAMVIAFGRLNMHDRAFAIFQEYEPLFKVQPNLHSYNSLLHATTLASSCTTKHVFVLFETMENLGKTQPALAPDATSYSTLINYLITARENSLADQLSNYLLESSQTLEPYAWRRLATYHAVRGHRDKIDKIYERMKECSPTKSVPKFLMDKVDQLLAKRTQGAAARAASPSKPNGASPKARGASPRSTPAPSTATDSHVDSVTTPST